MNDTTKNQYRFDVFISYARSDSVQVESLVARLRTDGFRVWFDRDEMSGGQTTIRQLADGIACSAHMIVCLSDSYVDREYTDFELQTNQSFDPANRQNRTVPVLIGPLSKSVPVQIRAFNYGDLTQQENYEREYRLITSLIRKASAQQVPTPAEPELDADTADALCAAALEAQAEPQVALFKARLATESLSRFLYRREIGEPPANATLDALVEQLVVAHKLPPQINISLGTVRTYGDFAVSEGSAEISTEAIQPALAALKVLTNWIIATHLSKVEDRDEWDALCSQLPPGDKPGEHLIPGTRYVLREPRLGLNRLGNAVYAGRDAETRQAVTMLLVPVSKDQGDDFHGAVERLICLNESGIVRPLRTGRIQSARKRIGDYAVFESVAGVRVSELQQRFLHLPPLAVCEIGRGIAQTLEVLHNATPPIVHGEVGPGAALVTNFGGVKLICMLSTDTPVGSLDDLKALSATMADLLAGDETRVEPVARLLQALEGCTSAADSCQLLDSACREMFGGTSLRIVVDCYRKNKPLPGDQPAAKIKTGPHKVTSFEMVCELELMADGAWPAGPGRVLAWDQGSRELLLARDGAVVWRDDRAMRLRCVVQAAAGRCAAAGWDGRVQCFSPDHEPISAQLAGAIGDLRYLSGYWVAGTWQHTLASISEDGSVQSLPPAIEAGVYRIAATDPGGLFAVADLAGGIWLYSGGRRIAGVPPLAHVRDLAFCGRRLVVLAGDCLIWIGQDGTAGPPERLPSGRNRLLAYHAEGGCLLLAEEGSSWELATSGARLPHHKFPSGGCIGMCDVPKRFVARLGDGWAYWRDGTAPVHAWPDALSAEISADGSHVAIRLPGKVQLYTDPL
jgi:hypothetical protein